MVIMNRAERSQASITPNTAKIRSISSKLKGTAKKITDNTRANIIIEYIVMMSGAPFVLSLKFGNYAAAQSPIPLMRNIKTEEENAEKRMNERG